MLFVDFCVFLFEVISSGQPFAKETPDHLREREMGFAKADGGGQVLHSGFRKLWPYQDE